MTGRARNILNRAINNNKKNAVANTAKPPPGIKDTYIDKCKRYLGSLPVPSSSKGNAKKKLNFVRNKIVEAAEESRDNDVDENTVSAVEPVANEEPGDPNGESVAVVDQAKVAVAIEVEDTPADTPQNVGGTSGTRLLLWMNGSKSPSESKDDDDHDDDMQEDNVVQDDMSHQNEHTEIVTGPGEPSEDGETSEKDEEDRHVNSSLEHHDDFEEEEEIFPKRKRSSKRKNIEKHRKSKTIKKVDKSKRAFVQSVKNGFLTIKFSLKHLQSKNGLDPDFLLIMKNNAQKKQKRNSSHLAEKFLTFGAGSLKERFSSGVGVKFNPREFFILQNGENFDEDIDETTKAIKNMQSSVEDDVDDSNVEGSEKENHSSRQINRSVPKPVFLDDDHETVSVDHDEDLSERSDNSDTDSEFAFDIFNMRSNARRVSTPGAVVEATPDVSTPATVSDPGSLVYGNGAKKTSPEIQKQRDENKRKKQEAAKKVQSDILETGKATKKGKGKAAKGGKKKTRSVRF